MCLIQMVFITLNLFYPRRFPTIWERINGLADEGNLRSVREVRKELEGNSPSDYIFEWVFQHKELFFMPNEEEQMVVAVIFRKEQYRGLVRRSNNLKGLPVCRSVCDCCRKGTSWNRCDSRNNDTWGARIPTVCKELNVECINLERFLELENLQY